jgi:hypothetical protein
MPVTSSLQVLLSWQASYIPTDELSPVRLQLAPVISQNLLTIELHIGSPEYTRLFGVYSP